MTEIAALFVHRVVPPILVVLAAWLLPASAAAGPRERDFTFARGVNVSHWLAQNHPGRPYAGDWFDEEDVAWIAARGFDHLRIPIDGRKWVLPGSLLNEAKIAPFDRALDWARQHGLGVVLDMHALPGANADPEYGDRTLFEDGNLQLRVIELWRRVARRYAGEGANLRFEILNEPTTENARSLHRFYAGVLAAIRESSPDRVVYLSVPRWQDRHSFDGFVVPDDKHVAVAFHFYQPLHFTHQRAPWVGFATTMPPVAFPGEPGSELTPQFLETRLREAANWGRAQQLAHPLYVSEFGVYAQADRESTQRYLDAFRVAADKLGLNWAVWDYQGGFAVRSASGEPTVVAEALRSPLSQ